MPVEVKKPNTVYKNLIKNVKFNDIPGLNKKRKPDYSNLKTRVEGYLSAKAADEQFKMDVALWYGFLKKNGGTQWKKDMCLRLFCLLAHGGLMVHRQNRWIPWCNVGPNGAKGAPICSAISHTARVLVWLPPNEEGAFFNWLFGDPDKMETQTRQAATHGIETCQLNNIVNGVSKGVKENKSGSSAKHYGVNIALGGNNNINPISGKGIRENGKHGHLYIAVAKNLYHGRRAMLVATEQSSPIDRQDAVRGKHGKWGRIKSIKPHRLFYSPRKMVFVPDQYGGGHGLGGHSRFSATGGDDFNYKDKPSNLEAYGPSRGNYLDGMYLDLTAARFQYIQEQEFTMEMIGTKGFGPPTIRERPQRRPRPRRNSFQRKVKFFEDLQTKN